MCLSVSSHALPVLPGCALTSLWLEGKVLYDAQLMKTREGSNK